MAKARIKELAEKYNMKIMWNADKQRAFGVILDSENEIPELDILLREHRKGVVARRYDWFDSSITYRFDCPYEWFDKDGWSSVSL